MKKDNPFVLYGYEGPDRFCDRKKETRILEQAVRNGRNVTILAERRIGKTGLIKHLFNRLDSKGWRRSIYVDIFSTSNLAEFTTRLAEAVVGSMDSRLDKAIVAASRFFSSFRPGVALDPVTGAPTFSFAMQPQSPEATLKECFDYISHKKGCVVAIDEFQQIAFYPEKGVEALLRSYVQFLPDARFIFAGSRHHMMAEMFASAKRPFYNSTQTLPLDRIDSGEYYSFAKAFMDGARVALKQDVFDFAYSLFDGITWYVQAVMNRLYERRVATDAEVRNVVDELVIEKSWEFASLMKSLPAGSLRLLKAIAKTGKVKAPMSGDFMSANSLKSVSSVRLALNRLVDDELVYAGDDGYVVYDRLFGFWLRRQA